MISLFIRYWQLKDAICHDVSHMNKRAVAVAVAYRCRMRLGQAPEERLLHAVLLGDRVAHQRRQLVVIADQDELVGTPQDRHAHLPCQTPHESVLHHHHSAVCSRTGNGIWAASSTIQ